MKAVLEEFDKWIKRAVPVEVPLTEHNFSPGLLRFLSKYHKSEVQVLAKELGLAIVEDVLMFRGKVYYHMLTHNGSNNGNTFISSYYTI